MEVMSVGTMNSENTICNELCDMTKHLCFSQSTGKTAVELQNLVDTPQRNASTVEFLVDSTKDL